MLGWLFRRHVLGPKECLSRENFSGVASQVPVPGIEQDVQGPVSISEMDRRADVFPINAGDF
jgi:hypothetical protein